MKQSADWKKEEFEILLTNNSLSNEALTNQLPHRTIGAIDAVRNGIHEFHKKGNSTLLSKKMMKDHLTKPNEILVCPICGERIDIHNL